MSENNKGFGFEVSKMLGFGRSRATNDLINMQAGEHSEFGLVADDTRCDAEWVEVSSKGKVTKSPKPDKN